MAYSYVTDISSRTALIQQLIAFAVANAGFVDQGSPYANCYACSKDGLYYAFVVSGTGTRGDGTPYRTVNCRMKHILPTSQTLFDNTSNGQMRETKIDFYANSGPYTGAFFYAHSNMVYMVVEIYPGVYNHFCMGVISKYGTWTGGNILSSHSSALVSSGAGQYGSGFSAAYQYHLNSFSTTAPSSSTDCYLYRPLGGTNHADFIPAHNLANTATTNTELWKGNARGRWTSEPFGRTGGASAFSSTPLGRMRIFSVVGTYDKIVGYLPNIRTCNLKLVTPEAIGDNVWKIFPYSAQTGSTTISHTSGNQYGIAYLEA